MPRRRSSAPRPGLVAASLVALLAAACASGPDLAGSVDETEAAPEAAAPADTDPADEAGPDGEPGPEVDDGPAERSDPPPAPPGPVPLSRIVTRGSAGGASVTIRRESASIPLTTAPVPRQPTWSRDGSRLVVGAQAPGGSVVEVFSADGTSLARAAVPRPYFFFSWSHDGTRIAALGPGDDGTTLDLLAGDGSMVAEAVTTAETVWVGWHPGSPTLAVHAGEDLLRVDDDGETTSLGAVGSGFYAPKWIPGSRELLLVVDLEGTATLVRRGAELGDSMTTLGPVPVPIGISVRPDGDVAALTLLGDPAGGGAREVTAGAVPVQQSGMVELVDLSSGERHPAFTGRALWTEWSPIGDRLLVGEVGATDPGGTWWVVEGDPEEAEARSLVDFVATDAFLGAYLAFGDQYVEQPRLWAPDGTAFVHPTVTAAGDLVQVVPIDGGEPVTVGPGSVGFWSPGG